MGGWLDGAESGFMDCLQQSKIEKIENKGIVRKDNLCNTATEKGEKQSSKETVRDIMRKLDKEK